MTRCYCDLSYAYKQRWPLTLNPLIAAFTLLLRLLQITVIPQDAHLFSGTVRQSIDPTGTVSDARLWEVIQQVGPV
jgi:ABC-type transport system involved in cytochrome bd biosynthesis fused ATPase/permease subunit